MDLEASAGGEGGTGVVTRGVLGVEAGGMLVPTLVPTLVLLAEGLTVGGVAGGVIEGGGNFSGVVGMVVATDGGGGDGGVSVPLSTGTCLFWKMNQPPTASMSTAAMT